MKAKRVTTLLIALTLTAALSACGNVDSEPAWKSIESEVESEGLEMVKDEEPEEEKFENTTEEVPEESEDESEIVESEDASEEVDESEEAVEVVENEDTVAEEDAESKEAVESKNDKTEKPKTSAKTDTSTKTSESSTPAQPEVPVSTPAPTPAPTPEPVHEHSWKEHVATTQVWVPNIVVVDDYEEQKTQYEKYICGYNKEDDFCGYETLDQNDIESHVVAHAYAGDIRNFTIQTHWKTEQVWVGSHEEDQGHYDTSSYVDYYYCDCGATK